MPVCTVWWRECTWQCRNQPREPHGTCHHQLQRWRQSTYRDSVHEAWIQCETSLYHSIACIYMIPFTVYYSLYTEDGDITPEHPINCNGDDSPSVARIDKTLVPPPHSPDSIIRCISYIEGFSYCAWHRLFTSVTSKSPINYMDAWVPERGGPGSTPDTPLIFVKFAARKLFIRPDRGGGWISCLWQSHYENSATTDPIFQYTVRVLSPERTTLVHFPSTPTEWFARKNCVSAMLAPEGYTNITLSPQHSIRRHTTMSTEFTMMPEYMAVSN